MPQNLQFIVIPIELLQIRIYLTDTGNEHLNPITVLTYTKKCCNLNKIILTQDFNTYFLLHVFFEEVSCWFKIYI